MFGLLALIVLVLLVVVVIAILSSRRTISRQEKSRPSPHEEAGSRASSEGPPKEIPTKDDLDEAIHTLKRELSQIQYHIAYLEDRVSRLERDRS
jgi:flagellar biosynthesis/type III secretory pathway M-ring protein FliF/YscJ